jgi:hypothetical protein
MIGLGCAPRIIVSADSAKSEDKVMPKIQTASIKIGYETCGDGEPLLLIMGLGLPGRHGSAGCLFSLNLTNSL